MKDQLEDYIIISPIDGVITSQDIEKGDMVAAGTLLTSVSDKDTMEFVIPIDELDIAKINYGQEVRVKIDALDETETNPLNGKITDIPEEGVTVAGVTDYYVTIQVSGNQSMKISMNANADIVINSVKDVLTIPVDSIIKENGKKYVDVLLQDGVTVERKEIETGASDITNIEVKSGLEEGEKVIIPEVNSGISFFM
jgi:HlyD family secretion protein